MMADSMAKALSRDEQGAHNSVVFTGADLFPGTGEEVVRGGFVWVEGQVIRKVGSADGLSSVPGDVPMIDLGGRFVMPGMTEAHAHLSYYGARSPSDQDRTAVEESMLHAVDHARIMLGCGYTSAISFGSVHRIDVFLRDGISNGWIPGPRLVASGRDVSATSGLVDWHPEHFGPQVEGLGMLVDGPWEIRKAVRKVRKAGGDVVKVFLDGEGVLDHAHPGELTYTDEEVDAAVDEAHRRQMRVVCHARSAGAVKQAVRFGVDIVGHANYLDDEALDLLRAQRHRIFVGPAVAWELALLQRAEEFGFSRDFFDAKGYTREVEETVTAVRRLRQAGVRVLPGGDFGLQWTPHGTYALDLQYFVEQFGYTSFDTLVAATRDAGAAMDPGGMVGTLEEGTWADLVVVDGDPLTDITVLQDHAKIIAVMKDGVMYRGLLTQAPYVADPEALTSAEDGRLGQVERFSEPVSL